MIKSNSFEALTFICDNKKFNTTISNLTSILKYNIISDLVENGIYSEIVLSKKNIFEELNTKLSKSNLSYFEYDNVFIAIIDSLIYLIHNKEKSVLFIVSSNLSKLDSLIAQLQLEKYMLFDKSVENKIYSKELNDLIEVGLKYKIKSYDGIMSLSVDTLPQNESILDSMAPLTPENTTITKYTRSFQNYSLEVQFPNQIIIHNYNENAHIGKALSKSIIKD